jgi:dephospho-CoA kinase
MIIGLTGGCGSGKSKIAEILEDNYNAYIITADKIGHEIIKKGTKAYNLIIGYFGNVVLDCYDEISRKKLGDIVFSNEEKLKKLNEFTHKYIYIEIKNKINEAQINNHDIIVVEAAIMTKLLFGDLVDYIIYIYCGYDERVNRLNKYRNIPIEKAKQMIYKQPTDNEYKNNAHYILDNTFSIDNSIDQLEKIVKYIKEDKNEVQ